MLLAPDVTAAITLSPGAELVVIQATVAAAPARPLGWRLTVNAQGPGGTSRTVQSGTTRGGPDPVTVVRINADAAGEARLEVTEGGETVAEDTVTLEPARGG